MNTTPIPLMSTERNVPELRFESQHLTSFSGLVIVQMLVERLGLARRLQRAFRRRERGRYRFWKLFLLLIVYRLVGFRRLRDAQTHREDPLIKQVVGLNTIPDVSTLSRRLRAIDEKSIEKAREENRNLVIDALAEHKLSRITLDFDGSVIDTRRHAEGSAVGFNRKRKGERSYYPLLCTVAQSAQAFDLLHRPGNVHDSQGADEFMRECITAMQKGFPNATLETRTDSAFFNEQLVATQEHFGVQYSVSVPFQRFPQLKGMIEDCSDWSAVDEKTDAFELDWKPACWEHDSVRLIALRTSQAKQRKGPLQLDLFEPTDFEYTYQVIATNRKTGQGSTMAFHHGRGSQEGVIGELKAMMNMDYIPSNRRRANEIFMLASVYAHNILRALQMIGTPPSRVRGWKRPACWIFQRAHTIRTVLLLRAGRLTRPGNRKTLTISGDEAVAQEFTNQLEQLRLAA